MTELASAQEITMTRVFDAPRELVWKAWTEPEQLARWWGKRGWNAQLSTITMEVRPGGTFRLTSVSDEDGSEMPQEGVYREVVEPERLVVAEAAEDAWHEGAVTAVHLSDLGDGRTELVLRTTIHTTDEMRRHAEAGVASSLDRLAEQLVKETTMDFRLEVVVIPVSDVDRAKAFYAEKAGFHVDHDTRLSDEMRIVQLTPPGSACSIVIGTMPPLPDMEPGSFKGLQLVVSDVEAARAELAGRGVEVSEVQLVGPADMDGSKFVFFRDPDENAWGVQEYRGGQSA
jgi:uncharacterized protein YndB with AHSA1/START domain/catechol 2,3-dioxygenase-like lactoylglutathione lyase family enzyme